jgi:hypothetical protein
VKTGAMSFIAPTVGHGAGSLRRPRRPSASFLPSPRGVPLLLGRRTALVGSMPGVAACPVLCGMRCRPLRRQVCGQIAVQNAAGSVSNWTATVGPAARGAQQHVVVGSGRSD